MAAGRLPVLHLNRQRRGTAAAGWLYENKSTGSQTPTGRTTSAQTEREAVNTNMVMYVYMYVNFGERIDYMHILTYLSKNMIVSIYVFIHTLSSATILAKGKQCRCWRTEEETAICLGGMAGLLSGGRRCHCWRTGK